jgi:hypothetical protein
MKVLQDTQIAQKVQQNAVLTCPDEAPANGAEQMQGAAG